MGTQVKPLFSNCPPHIHHSPPSSSLGIFPLVFILSFYFFSLGTFVLSWIEVLRVDLRNLYLKIMCDLSLLLLLPTAGLKAVGY